MGRDRAAAVDEAREANQYLIQQQAPSLVERISVQPVTGRTLAAFAPIYEAALDDRELAPLTLYSRKRHLVRITAALGHLQIGPRQEDAAELTRSLADWLRGFSKKGKRRTAKQLRSTLSDLCAEMAAAGWLAVNPAKVITLQRVIVKRARLTLEDFWKIYEVAGALDPWARRSMELGIVSLQRREDIAPMSFRHIEDDRLLVQQRKSRQQTRLRIPLGIRLDAVGWTLGEIIARCRDDVVSSWLVHHTQYQGRARPGAKVHPQTITGAFAEARNRASIIVPAGKTPPTYHELRSLGIRLYEKQGYDPQALAGHKDAETTALYKDSRGAEWIDVAA